MNMHLDILNEQEKIELLNEQELYELFCRYYKRMIYAKNNLETELTTGVFKIKYNNTLDGLLILCEGIISAHHSALLENNVDIFVREFISKEVMTLTLADPNSDLNTRVNRITEAAQTIEDSEKVLKLITHKIFNECVVKSSVNFVTMLIEHFNNSELHLLLDLFCTHPDKGRDLIFEIFTKFSNQEIRDQINNFYCTHFHILRDLFKKKKIRGINPKTLELNLNLYELENIMLISNTKIKEPIGKRIRRKLEKLVQKYKDEIISRIIKIKQSLILQNAL